MNLISRKKHKKIYLVLVPHRDTRLVLRKYSESLFKAGFSGAFDFPWAAPLASLSQPLNEEELKNFSRALRENAGSKISAEKAAFCAFEKAALFGPLVNIKTPEGLFIEAADKVREIFSRPVIGSCLLPADFNAAMPPPPELSFSAAAVANMYLTRSDEGGAVCVKWKIGKLFWLPAARNAKKC